MKSCNYLEKLVFGAVLSASALSLSAYTATFDADDTSYLWSDTSIWDTVPSAAGDVNIFGNGHLGSSITYPSASNTGFAHSTLIEDGAKLIIKDASTYTTAYKGGGATAYAMKLNNAYLDVLEGSTLVFGNQGGGAADAASLNLSGSSVFNLSSSTMKTANYFKMALADSSEFNMTNSKILGPYFAYTGSGSSSFVLDNSTLRNAADDNNQQLWSSFLLSNTASFTLKNSSSLVLGAFGTQLIELRDNSSINVQSGSTMTMPYMIELYNSASINIDGASSTLNANGGISLSGASTINVRNGGQISLNGLVIDGNSATMTVDSSSKLGLTGVVSSASAGSSMTFDNGTVIERTLNAISFSPTGTTITFTGGAKYDALARNGPNIHIKLGQDGKLIFDNGILNLGSYGYVGADSGEISFKNGATLTGTFLGLDMKGASKFSLDGTDVRKQSFEDAPGGRMSSWSFADTSVLELKNGAILASTAQHYQGGAYTSASYALFSGSAKLDVSGGSKFSFGVADNNGNSADIYCTIDSVKYYQKVYFKNSASASIIGTSAKSSTFEARYLYINSEALGEKTSFKLQGYTTMKVVDDINLGTDATALGKQEIVVSGGNNSVNIKNLYIANDSLLKLSGSGNTFLATGDLNFTGGEIEFNADSLGVTVLEFNTISAFDGILHLDFTGYVFDENPIKLVQANADWSAIANLLIGDKTRWNQVDAEGNILELEYNNNALWLVGTNVPEPSAYAAILGVLALGFAAYRRKQKK